MLVAEGGDHWVAVPLGLAGDELLPRLQQLPAFDNESYIRAMADPREGMIICWRRGAAADEMG